MAAGGETELSGILVEYINNRAKLGGMLLEYMSDESDGTELRKILQTKLVAIRHDLLMSVSGIYAQTGVYRAALRNDVEMVRCMLAEFTPEQAYSVLKLQTGDGYTPLHAAARFGRVEVVKYLLSCVNQQQRFNLLMMKGYRGCTVLHAALAHKRDTAELILSTLSLEQQLQLINIKDEDNKSVADLYPGFTPVELVAKGMAVIDELRQEIQRGRDKQTELEKMLAAFEEKFDIFIRTPIVFGGEDDHQHVSWT